MNILVILENFEESCFTIDKTLELSKAYGVVIECDFSQYATSIGEDVSSKDYILIRGRTFNKYYSFFSKEAFRGKLMVIYDALDQELASRIIKCQGMNSLDMVDFNYKSIWHLMLEPRNLNELSSYLLQIKDNDIKERPAEDGAKSKGHNSLYKLNKERDIKVIGVFSPLSTGKTTLSALIASSLESMDEDALLIDTDTLKKELIYYFTFDEKYYSRFSGMIRSIDRKQKVYLDDNLIKISNKIQIAGDHRDTNYSINVNHIRYMIENTSKSTIVIDISREYEPVELNEILKLCNYRLLVMDKNICNMNNIVKLLDLERVNRDVDIIFNREILGASITDKEALQVINYDGYLNIHNIYSIHNDYKSIVENLNLRQTAYKKSKILRDSIDKLINSIYKNKNKISLYEWMIRGVRYGNKT